MIRSCLYRSHLLNLTQHIRFRSDLNHYALLEIKEGASKKEIKAAYFRRAKQCHPDLYPDNPTKCEEYLQLQSSYNALMSTSNHTSESNTSPENNFAQEIDREFLKSVWRDPLPRDKTGSHLNSSLSSSLSPSLSSSLSRYYNKILNLLAILGFTGLTLTFLFNLLASSVSCEESEEDKERRERYEYYRTLNRDKGVT